MTKGKKSIYKSFIFRFNVLFYIFIKLKKRGSNLTYVFIYVLNFLLKDGDHNILFILI